MAIMYLLFIIKNIASVIVVGVFLLLPCSARAVQINKQMDCNKSIQIDWYVPLRTNIYLYTYINEDGNTVYTVGAEYWYVQSTVPEG